MTVMAKNNIQSLGRSDCYVDDHQAPLIFSLLFQAVCNNWIFSPEI